MKHEKIIKRQAGSQIKIEVELLVNSFYSKNQFEYKIEISTKKPNKRIWIRATQGDDYDYRKLSMEERRESNKLFQLKFATKEEIHEAKLELWNQLKPTI